MSMNGTPEYHGSSPQDYSTAVLRDDAVSFIRDTPGATPLFLYFAPKAPHTPTTAAPRYVQACQDVQPSTPPDLNEADVSDKPAYIRDTPIGAATRLSHRKQCRSLLAVDDAISA